MLVIFHYLLIYGLMEHLVCFVNGYLFMFRFRNEIQDVQNVLPIAHDLYRQLYLIVTFPLHNLVAADIPELTLVSHVLFLSSAFSFINCTCSNSTFWRSSDTEVRKVILLFDISFCDFF